jgi:hypothetical protein
MARTETRGNRDCANFRPNASDVGFVVEAVIAAVAIGAAIAAIAIILLSVALGVGIAAEASMFASP